MQCVIKVNIKIKEENQAEVTLRKNHQQTQCNIKAKRILSTNQIQIQFQICKDFTISDCTKTTILTTFHPNDT